MGLSHRVSLDKGLHLVWLYPPMCSFGELRDNLKKSVSLDYGFVLLDVPRETRFCDILLYVAIEQIGLRTLHASDKLSMTRAWIERNGKALDKALYSLSVDHYHFRLSLLLL